MPLIFPIPLSTYAQRPLVANLPYLSQHVSSEAVCRKSSPSLAAHLVRGRSPQIFPILLSTFVQRLTSIEKFIFVKIPSENAQNSKFICFHVGRLCKTECHTIALAQLITPTHLIRFTGRAANVTTHVGPRPSSTTSRGRLREYSAARGRRVQFPGKRLLARKYEFR